MKNKPSCPDNDYSAEVAGLSAGLRPLLTDLVNHAIEAGSTKAAEPLIKQATNVIATNVVDLMRKQLEAAAFDGFLAGRAEPAGRIQ